MTQQTKQEPGFEPSPAMVVGDTADIFFHRAISVLRAENINPTVVMEFAPVGSGILSGVPEAKALLDRVLPETEREVWALEEGTAVTPREVVLRVKARYSTFCVYETAIAGILAHSTAWATAARQCVEAAHGIPVVCTGARYIYPTVVGRMEYAAVVGGCASCSTVQGARLAGVSPWGSVPHGLVLIFGDTVRAAQAFDKHVPQDVPRIVPVDTLRDEVEDALSLSKALKERLRAVRLDPPRERGRTTPDTVKELRARLDMAGFNHVEIVVGGGMTPERIREFVEAGAPVSTFSVGEYIASARPLLFTGDIHDIDGKPAAKRGRIPGITPSQKLSRVL